MTTNYDGLTRNIWTGTWSPDGKFPIVLDTEVRGTLQGISGDLGDRLTDITGQRLTEGMLVYLKTGYTVGLITRDSDSYYKYLLLPGEVRDPITGEMPNAEANWTKLTLGGGGTDYVAIVEGGTGVTVTGGTGPASTATVSIGQPVATTDSVEFGNVTVGTTGALRFTDDIALAAAHGANFPYQQISAASRFYTNADAALGYATNDMKPGDFYYDDVSQSIYICIDTGLGYYDFLDLTQRA